jgi:hypothetical protein
MDLKPYIEEFRQRCGSGNFASDPKTLPITRSSGIVAEYSRLKDLVDIGEGP